MIPFAKTLSRFGHAALLAVSVALPGIAQAGTALPDKPLFVGGGVPPLLMLVMSRNHKLYFEAYNDASDLNGDGELDLNYKPGEIDYFGYFDSYKCYTYASSETRWVPNSTTSDKTCSGSSEWSGDFLNYLTTSRMDALRKVLYGGKRSVDSTTDTVLQRAYIPQDAHTWGKGYAGISEDGYDITKYTPLSQPNTGTRHLFASTNRGDSTDSSARNRPQLLVLENKNNRIWDWVAKESPVADDSLGTPQEYVVKVEVCKAGMLEDNCTAYQDDSGNTTYKPTGVLHEFGEDDRMKFGLLTGSYENNYSGGVLRRMVGSFQEEVNADTGQFTSVNGIVATIDRLRTINFSGHNYDCGFNEGNRRSEGECNMWGNPVAEMMYESLRYFSGKSSPTAAFDYGSSGPDADTLGLPKVDNWNDPYSGSDAAPECSRAFQLVLSDTRPNYDSDQLPGVDSNFDTGFSGSSTFNGAELDVSSESQAIWNSEPESSPVFIGEAGSDNDGAPTPKSTSGFGEMRGLVPEEPNKRGSYYSGGVAYFGKKTDINPAPGRQSLDTFSVALSSPLPRIRIPAGDSVVQLVPFGKRVGEDGSTDIDQSGFQETTTIVDFFVETIANTSPQNQDDSVNGGRPFGRFRINYEDAQAGADYDQDTIALYEFAVTSTGKIDVTVDTSASPTGSTGDFLHLGYVIDGTENDGVYLEVRNPDTSTSEDPDYYLDTPPGVQPGGNYTDGVALPLTTTRTFTPGQASASFVRHDPLWYAAKYGGFIDENDNLEPDLTSEWDSDGNGDPDNYFFVSNAGELDEQLTEAFEEILSVVGAASSVAVNSTKLDSSTVTYQATFNSENWEGDLKAFEFLNDGSGNLASMPIWSAQNQLPSPANRDIYTTVDTSMSQNTKVAFDWSVLEATSDATTTLQNVGVDEAVVDYIRGVDANEQRNGGTFRNRDGLIGDIIDSSPEFVGQQNFGYATLDDPDVENDPGDKYRDYLADKGPRERVVFVGANDGMLHAFNAGNYDSASSTFDQGTGEEIFGYVPEAVHADLPALTQPSYEHQYYVNGSLFAGDAYIQTGDDTGDKWHTVLTGAFAHGHKGIFAIDVAESGSSDLKIKTNPANAPMWEFTPENIRNNANIPDSVADELGHILGQPQIVRLDDGTTDGTYAAVFGNGYNSNNGNATLFVVDLETGEPITNGVIVAEDDDPDTASAPNVGDTNGLATPYIVDEDGDRMAEYAYAGDLKGNIWKFNLDLTSPNGVGVAHSSGGNPAPLFQAHGPDNNPQPITSQPVVGVPPDGRNGVMVYFGTGKYFAVRDSTLPDSPQIQSVYGVHDDGDDNKVADAARQSDGTVNALVEQTITQQVETTVDGEDIRLRQISDNAVDYSNADTEGWYLDLAYNGNAVGEQVVSSPVLRFGRLSITTFTPTEDPCEFGGTSWFQQVDALTGSRLDESAIDVNNDGVIDEDDLIDIDGDGNPDPVSGRQLGGVIAQPVVINDSGQDRAIFSKLCNNQDCEKTETELTQGGGLSVGRQSWRELDW